MAPTPDSLAHPGYLRWQSRGGVSASSISAGSAWERADQVDGVGGVDEACAGVIEARSAALETDDDPDAPAIDTAASNAAAGERVSPPWLVDASVRAETVSAVEQAGE